MRTREGPDARHVILASPPGGRASDERHWSGPEAENGAPAGRQSLVAVCNAVLTGVRKRSLEGSRPGILLAVTRYPCSRGQSQRERRRLANFGGVSAARRFSAQGRMVCGRFRAFEVDGFCALRQKTCRFGPRTSR